MAKVLLIEDSPEVVALAVPALRDGGHDVMTCGDGIEALREMRDDPAEVVILDLGLPGLDGVEVCRELRSFSDAYVIILSARIDEGDKIDGLRAGADDYVTKPFSPRELAARVEAVLRRPRLGEGTEVSSPAVIEWGDLTVLPERREVAVAGEPVSLTKIEFELLLLLIGEPDIVQTKQVVSERIWGPDGVSSDHVIDVHLANLRRKIDGDGPSRIRTVRGVGYRMEDLDRLERRDDGARAEGPD